MMMSIMRWLTGLAVCVMTGSCMRRDKDAPWVRLDFPSADSLIRAGDEIRIIGMAGDEVGLESISAELQDLSGNVIRTTSATAGGQSVQAELRLAAGDRYTPGGSYKLRLRAQDKAGNFNSDWMTIRIEEVPRVLIRTFIDAELPSTGDHALYSLDSGGVLQLVMNLEPGITDMECDNRQAVLLYCSSLTSRLKGADAQNPNQLLFNQLQDNGGMYESFSGISITRYHYYTSSLLPAYLLARDLSGVAEQAFLEAAYPATCLLASGTLLWAGEQSPNGQITRVNAFHLNTRKWIANFPTDFAVDELEEGPQGWIFAAGSRNGQTHSIALSPEDLSLREEDSLSGEFRGIAHDETSVFVLTATGLYRWSPPAPPQWLTANPGWTCIRWEELHGCLFAGKQGGIDKISAQGVVLNTWTGITGSARRIALFYNK